MTAREQVIEEMRDALKALPGGQSCGLQIFPDRVFYFVWVGDSPFSATTFEEALAFAHENSAPGIKLRQASELRAKADALEAEARTLAAIANSPCPPT